MKAIILFFIVYSFDLFARNYEQEIAFARATAVAQLLLDSENLEEFSTKIALTSSDKSVFKQDLKKGKIFTHKIPKFIYSKTKIEFKNQKITFDFRDISKNTLYVNETAISVENPVSYVEALLKIKRIFKKSISFLERIVPKAYAEGDSLGEYMFAAIISSSWMGKNEDLKLRSAQYALEETLLQTYTANNLARQVQQQFSCENKRLKNIFTGYGKSRKILMTYDPEKNEYSGEYVYFNISIPYEKKAEQIIAANCVYRADGNGAVIETKPNSYSKCAKKGESIFEIEHQDVGAKRFGEYPRVADACCQKEGCAERVLKTISAINLQERKEAEKNKYRGSQ